MVWTIGLSALAGDGTDVVAQSRQRKQSRPAAAPRAVARAGRERSQCRTLRAYRPAAEGLRFTVCLLGLAVVRSVECPVPDPRRARGRARPRTASGVRGRGAGLERTSGSNRFDEP